MNENKRIKLLYIAGAGRSGSTVIDRVLGQVPGFFSLGELHAMWPKVMRDDWQCGCGKILKQCEFWSAVLHDAFGSDAKIERKAQEYQNYGGDRIRYMPLMQLPGAKWLLTRRVRQDLGGLVALYKAIGANTGCRVIVDSSKLPTYGFALSQSPALDMYVVHLVRDQRGVAYSWRRRKARTDVTSNGAPVEYMGKMGPVASSLVWNGVNVATEQIWKRTRDRYLLVRYEDFVAEPEGEVRRICRLVGEEPDSLPFIDGNEVTFGTDHTVAGNPSRMAKGIVTLQADDEWKRSLPAIDRMIVNTLSAPLLRRYGYLNGHNEQPERRLAPPPTPRAGTTKKGT